MSSFICRHCTGTLMTLLLTMGGAHAATNLNINGLTLETGSGKTLGTLSSQGGMDDFTKLQKELVLTVIKQLGIDIENLPPAIRGQIEKPQTSNPQALQAFAKGLDLADKGQFQAAAAAFKEAAKQDPGFALAAGMARLMPQVNLGSEGGGGALRAMRRVARDEGQRHGEQRLNRMNRPGNRMRDLGVSDGRGKKGDDAKMDPVDLVTDQEEGGQNNQGGGGNEQTLLAHNVQTPATDDNQRQDVAAAIPPVDAGGEEPPPPDDGGGQPPPPDDGGAEPLSDDFQGFSAGVYDDCYDGCYEMVASASSSSVLFHFRPDEFGQVDASIYLEGDMLSGVTSPSVIYDLISECGASDPDCPFESEVAGTFSTYLDKNNFYIYMWDSSVNDFIELWTESSSTDSSQFSYSSWGVWDGYNDEASDFYDGYWVAGQLTPAANIPNTGSVNYTGGMVGVTENYVFLQGSMNWTVNFANRTVTGTFDDIVTEYGSTWLNSANVNGGWSAGTNAVSATLSGSQITSGVANGAFFGPHGEELGGTWRINKFDGEVSDKASGIFLGKEGGVPFVDCYVMECNVLSGRRSR